MSTGTIERWNAFGVLAIFALAFFVAYRRGNYSVVDVVWSYSVGLGAIFYACFSSGWMPRRAVLAVVMALWSVRLGTHILRRLLRSRQEDPRYHEMRTRWPSYFKTKMAAVFLFQAALVWGLDGAALLPMENRFDRFQFIEWVGFAVTVGSMAGEALADRQLREFKQDSKNADQVCAVGLWRYSRHPNYFFEWLFWVGIALVAWPSPRGEYGLLAPAGMLLFLSGITGIPPTERQSLRSKGEQYRKYQQTTSAFIPWPPRTTTSAK